MVGYYEIINKIKNFCDSHAQIKQFDNGKSPEVNTEIQYPYVFLYYQNGTVNKNQEIFNFDLYVLDKVKYDRTNLDSVIDHTDRIGKDILYKFKEEYLNTNGFYIDLSNGLNVEVVDNSEAQQIETSDFTAGNLFTLRILTNLNSQYNCNYPPVEDNTVAPIVYSGYYIASTDDIIGYDMSNTFTGTFDLPTKTFELTTLNNIDWLVDDKVYINPNTINNQSYGGTVSFILLKSLNILTDVSITQKVEVGQRCAKLTGFVSADYSELNNISGKEEETRFRFDGVDLTSLYSTGDKIRLTDDRGNYYYDIVKANEYNKGNSYITVYLHSYTNNRIRIIEKMTNIV